MVAATDNTIGSQVELEFTDKTSASVSYAVASGVTVIPVTL